MTSDNILQAIWHWFLLRLCFEFEDCLGRGITWETCYRVRLKVQLFPWCVFPVYWISFGEFSLVGDKKQVSFENKRMQPKCSHSPLATETQLFLISESKQIRASLLRVGHGLLYVFRIYSEMLQFEIVFDICHSNSTVFAKHSVFVKKHSIVI